jgi:hypothetical protein
MTGPLSYPPPIRCSLSAFLGRIEKCGEGFAEWTLKKTVGIAVEIVIGPCFRGSASQGIPASTAD